MHHRTRRLSACVCTSVQTPHMPPRKRRPCSQLASEVAILRYSCRRATWAWSHARRCTSTVPSLHLDSADWMPPHNGLRTPPFPFTIAALLFRVSSAGSPTCLSVKRSMMVRTLSSLLPLRVSCLCISLAPFMSHDGKTIDSPCNL
jgi:hypothetical protein